ncbi:TIGR03747 family integrating conjugative element membrane protein [Pseudomonas sp. GOM7]|uniref:TIGR03747 family integrating conjugative element membrane protein n=1 Tax=Pseudomonas sp. GOM7 TaxID=2998079 RepID=UPI00227CCB12|nr:TIGR03747 family integrating conjugative element membrane protein [Pseudomonas sp. GOM7]WAJ37262.1 TIGR03747 family integrating conjugative element membrane protein [Pseudomonas sp. GOM7]
MADQSRAPAQPKEPPKGILGLIHKAKVAVGVLLLSLCVSILIEWLGIAFDLWDEEGYLHAKAMLTIELGWISDDFTRSLLMSDPGQAAQQLTFTAYEWLFVKTGFLDWIVSARQPLPQGTSVLKVYSNQLAVAIEDYLLATLYVTLTFMVRLVILTLTSPLFVMAAMVGLVDGLVRRDIRRFGAGRESSFVYHHSKRLIVPLFLSAWLIYLSLPFSVHPNWVLLPCALLLGLAVSITAGSFKKYL